MRDELHAYAALQKQVHEALIAEHPEWIEADGGSPMLELYDARFAEILTMLQPPASRSARRARLRSRQKAACRRHQEEG